jgi:RNA polymerase-binding protein DksA
VENPVEETQRVPAKKVAKKTAAKKVAKKAPVKKASTPATNKAPVQKTVTKKAPAKKAPATKAARKAPAVKTTAKRASAKNAAAKPAKPVSADLAEQWSQAELAEIRAELVDELARLESEYAAGMTELDDLQQRANDGAGDDQADAGTKTFEREQELSLLNNKHDLIAQSQRAIDRIDSGTYGRCESCGQPIAKARMQAFPSATLCVSCKQKQERR